jgi:hypothetical protein
VLAEFTGSQKARAERAGRIFAQGREFAERGCDVRAHLLKLPGEFDRGGGAAVVGR